MKKTRAILSILVASLLTGCADPNPWVEYAEICGVTKRNGQVLKGKDVIIHLTVKNTRTKDVLDQEFSTELGASDGRFCLRFGLGKIADRLKNLKPTMLSAEVDGRITGPEIMNDGGIPDFDYVSSTVKAEVEFDFDKGYPVILTDTPLFGMFALLNGSPRASERGWVSDRMEKVVAIGEVKNAQSSAFSSIAL